MIQYLDPDQQKILQPGSKFVAACPGAGKTRAIVSRYKTRNQDDFRGKALLSFTNRAVDECLSRMRKYPQLTAPPNFIGTFDQFNHMFLIRPWFKSYNDSEPAIIHSLEGLSDPPFVRTAQGGAGLGLWNFEFNVGGRSKLMESNLNSKEQIALGQFSSIWQAERIATIMHERLFRASKIDCAMARSLASHILSGPERTRYFERIAARFSEILVDEIQDCDPSEISILGLFKQLGLEIVGVADFDQSIYGFRGADLSVTRAFRESFGQDALVELTNNYRSTSAICNFISTLRAGPHLRSTANHNDHDYPTNVIVLSGSPEFAKKEFIRLLDVYNVSNEKAIVIARTWKSAKAIAGAAHYKPGKRFTDILVSKFMVLKGASASPSDKARAMYEAERLLLSLTKFSDVDEWPSREIARIVRGTSIRLRDATAEIMAIIATATTPEGLGQDLRDMLSDVLHGELREDLSLSNRVQRPSTEAWDHLRRFGGSSDAILQSSTVHSAKGGEWEAVLLSLDENPPIDAWVKALDCEDRRVFYVGASRASKMLIVHVVPELLPRISDGLGYHDLDVEWLVEEVVPH